MQKLIYKINEMSHSPGSVKFTLDCDSFGMYAAHPVSGSSEGSKIVPIPTTTRTFPVPVRRDSAESLNSDWAYDDEDVVAHSQSETYNTAITVDEYCQCNHDFYATKEKQTCSDSVLLSIMIGLTFIFSLCEFGFGFANSSLSLVADAFHMISDAAALVVAIFAIRLGSRPEVDSDGHTFGWKRAEVIGALINGVYLASVCLFIILEAILRIIEPKDVDNPWQVFGVGIAGLAINLIGLALFFSHRSLAQHGGHSHSHGEVEESNTSVNMHGVFLHVLSDAIGSIIVVATSLATIYVPYTWRYYFDPICSIIFALLILKSSIPLIRQCTSVLMQSAPRSISLSDMRNRLLQIVGVDDVHELHVWQMVPGYNVATVHVVLKSNAHRRVTMRACNDVFCQNGIHRTTIQFE